MARPRMTATEIQVEIAPHLASIPTGTLERMITGLNEAEFKEICRIPSRRARQWEVLDAITAIIRSRKQ